MSPGTFSGFQFVCTKCGAIAYGEAPPKTCPTCDEEDTYVTVEEESREQN